MSASVHLSPFCHLHQVAALQVLGLGPDDTWRAGLVVAQILLFGLVVDRADVYAACAGVIADIPVKFPGCPACRFPSEWDAATRALSKGLDHAAQVSMRRVLDPDCVLKGAPLVVPPSRMRP